MRANEQHESLQNSIGQVFTPSYVAEFMVKNIIKFYNNQKVNSPLPKQISELKVLEPAAGKGVFLDSLLANGFQNITAYELDTGLKKDLTRCYPNIHFKFRNFLGAPRDRKYDIIIGNPPYFGQNYNAELFQEYLKRYPICKKYFVGNMDIFYYFIHLAIEKLKPGGLLSFITTNYWITKSKKTGIKYLKPHILEECEFLQYIDLSNLEVFPGAKGQHNCIFTLKKRTIQDSASRKNQVIQIISIKKSNRAAETIFQDLLNRKRESYINRYHSATTNIDLQPAESWNLLYPAEVKEIVQKIEKKCNHGNETKYLKDFLLIRNGLIFISDQIFVLKENKNINIKDGEYYIKIKDAYQKLNKKETTRLKPLYKSKQIIPYGHKSPKKRKFAIYFNKEEFKGKSDSEIKKIIQGQYPTLHKYFMQYKNALKQTLINAKENPKDIFFPRRGASIRIKNSNVNSRLINLETNYDNQEKIFFKYILTTNEFGFSSEQYYATSDTYFIWKKSPALAIDYYLLIAYLNSAIVRFLFKAKNIKIKRSKTKLESNIPIPSFILEKTGRDNKNSTELLIIRAISNLSKIVVEKIGQYNQEAYERLDFHGAESVLEALEEKNIIEENRIIELNGGNLNLSSLKNLIDHLFFTIFNIDEDHLDKLIEKYY